jgi:hypothetical protein
LKSEVIEANGNKNDRKKKWAGRKRTGSGLGKGSTEKEESG